MGFWEEIRFFAVVIGIQHLLGFLYLLGHRTDLLLYSWQRMVKGSSLDWQVYLLPKRVAYEDVGDAIELVKHLIESGQPTWRIYLKTAHCVLWLSRNAIQEAFSSLLANARARSK